MNQLLPGDTPSQLPVRAQLSRDLPARPHYADYYYPEPVPEASGGLLEYWRIIQRRKGTVVLITFLGLLAAVIFTLPQTPVYQARTTIEIQGINEDFMQMRNVSPTASTSGYYPEYDIQTQVRVLQSRLLLGRVTGKLGLETKPLIANGTRISAWRTALGLAPAKDTSPRESALSMASSALKVRAQPNTRLIEILCDSTHPQVAADFANTLTSEFIEQNLEARWQTALHTGDWLTRQLGDVKIKLEKSEEALQEYARQTGLLFTQEKDNVSEQRLKQLQDELSRAQADRVSKQSRYELAANSSADSLAEVLEDPSLKDIQSKLTDLRRQLADLSGPYTPTHPKVKRTQDQIRVLESALERERGNIVRRIQNDFASAQRREKLLATDYNGQVKLMSGQMDKVAHYNILKREVDTNRQIYDSMLQRVKEAGIASALRASNVRIVDPAVVPKSPYKPSLATNSLLGLLSGIFLGIVVVVFQERADRTIQDPGELGIQTGVPELGVVPSAVVEPLRKRTLLPRFSKRTKEGRECLELVVQQRKFAAMSEAIRNTLASILYTGENGRRPKVIVLSSAAPKEGKTTICTNLAVALAQIHQRVLLIDADMRKPRIHSIFDLKNDKGLVDLLRKPHPIDTPLNGHVRETNEPNLSVMLSGPSSQNDPSLLHSDRLRELIELVRESYDTILIDTPPMLTMADARVIAREADAVVLVARAQQTSREGLREAYQRFKDDGVNVLGAVLNDWNPKRSSRYGYYRYYDRYKHYYGADQQRDSKLPV